MLLLAHLGPTWFLLIIHEEGPFVFGSLLFLLLPFLLQVGDGEQAKCGCGRRKGRGEIGRNLGFRDPLG